MLRITRAAVRNRVDEASAVVSREPKGYVRGDICVEEETRRLNDATMGMDNTVTATTT